MLISGTAPLPPRSKKSRKIRLGLPLGADTIMDLSTGKTFMKPGMDYPQLSRTYWNRTHLSSFVNGIAEDLTWDIP
jgi:hypothetical protein